MHRLKMKCPLLTAAIALAASTATAQLTNPIPASIGASGIRVRIENLVQMPATLASVAPKSDDRPGSRARLNFFREAPDGRLFVNDLRGQLYTLGANYQPQVYLDIDAANGGAGSIFPAAYFNGGLAAGLISYEFHPEFATNGKFYTIHLERAQDTTAVPDFATTDMRTGGVFPVKWHTVVNEWNQASPSAPTWNEATGTRRELLRVGTTADDYFHPLGDLQFNPTSGPGDPDYGLLYISSGDWGYINGAGAPQGSGTEGQPGQLQRLDTLAGTLMRIDPRSPAQSGGQAGLGDYTIPPSNPFVDGNPNTFDEVYALGFRNGHRMSWDDDGTLFVMNIGHDNLEEVERIIPGGNYGWAVREGSFINGNDLAHGGNGDADDVFTHNLSDAQDVDFRGQEFLYPVAQYDHGEGAAIAGGFVYQGDDLPQLQGKFIFGDIVNGRMFVSDVATMKGKDLTEPTGSALVQSIQLYTTTPTGAETNVSLTGLVGDGRADLRFGVDSEGEIYIMTKTDGFIRKLVGDVVSPLALYVDPATGEATLKNVANFDVAIEGYSVISDSNSLLPADGDWLSLQDQGVAGWYEAAPETGIVSELNTEAALTIGVGGSLSLGSLFDAAGGMRDLAFEFLLDAEGDATPGEVLYRYAGDFDEDGDVDGNDLTHPVKGWKARFGDGLDGGDLLTWQRQLGLSGGDAITAAGAVPEPASAGLALWGTLIVGLLSRPSAAERRC